MKRVKASLGMLAITALAAGALLSAGGGSRQPVARVQLCRVEMGKVEQVLAVSGVLRYEMEYAAISPVTGVVERVYVEPGDRVAAGQALFRLDDGIQTMAVSAALEGRGNLPEALAENLGNTQLREAALQLESLTVRSAAEGVVQQVSVMENGGVMAGSAGVALSGGKQDVQCSVVMRDAQELKAGMRARIIRDGETLTMATVRRVGPAEVSAATGQTVCQVSLTPETTIDLPLGSTLEVEVILYGQENVPVLPVQAVSEEGNIWWVAEGRSYQAPVEMVMADEVNCWVNLPEGMEVICGGEAVQQGQRVKEMKR